MNHAGHDDSTKGRKIDECQEKNEESVVLQTARYILNPHTQGAECPFNKNRPVCKALSPTEAECWTSMLKNQQPSSTRSILLANGGEC